MAGITDGLLEWVQNEVQEEAKTSILRARRAVQEEIVEILAPGNGMSPRRRAQFRRRVWISGSGTATPVLNVGIARFAMTQFQGQSNLARIWQRQYRQRGEIPPPEGQDPFIVMATDRTGRRFYFCVDAATKRRNALYRIPPQAIDRINDLVMEAINR